MWAARLRSLPCSSGQAAPARSPSCARPCGAGGAARERLCQERKQACRGEAARPRPRLRRQLGVRPLAAGRCRGTHRWETVPFSSRRPPSGRESEAVARGEKTTRRCSHDSSRLLLPTHTPRTGAASGSARLLRPLTPQPLPADPIPPSSGWGRSRLSPRLSAQQIFQGSEPAGNIFCLGLGACFPVAPAGPRCTAYSSHGPASPPASRRGRPGQVFERLQRAARLSEPRRNECRDVGHLPSARLGYFGRVSRMAAAALPLQKRNDPVAVGSGSCPAGLRVAVGRAGPLRWGPAGAWRPRQCRWARPGQLCLRLTTVLLRSSRFTSNFLFLAFVLPYLFPPAWPLHLRYHMTKYHLFL